MAVAVPAPHAARPVPVATKPAAPDAAVIEQSRLSTERAMHQIAEVFDLDLL
jgi:hypothetical protein